MKRLRYLSVAAPGLTSKEIQAFLARAEHRNQKHGITGLLLYGNGLFFQILEGPEDEVDALLERIRNNPYHHDLAVLGESEAPTRLFGNWSMRGVELATEIGREDAARLRTMLEGCRSEPSQVSARALEIESLIVSLLVKPS